jgi:hypothetical protein
MRLVFFDIVVVVDVAAVADTNDLNKVNGNYGKQKRLYHRKWKVWDPRLSLQTPAMLPLSLAKHLYSSYILLADEPCIIYSGEAGGHEPAISWAAGGSFNKNKTDHSA